MTKDPLRKLSKAFVLIIIVSKEAVVVVITVCHSRTPRGMMIILPQVIQLHFGDWEVAVVYRIFGGVGIQDSLDNLYPHKAAKMVQNLGFDEMALSLVTIIEHELDSS